MLIDATLAVQAAVLARLTRSDAAARDVVPDRVFDRVPKGTVPGYVRIGNNDQYIPTLADCYDGAELFLPIECFGSREDVGKPGVKRIVAAVKEDLHQQEDFMELEGHRLQLFELYRVDYRTEPDGLTERALMTFRALTEPK